MNSRAISGATAALVGTVAAVITGCGGAGGSPRLVAATGQSSGYCGQVVSMHPQPGMPFEEEGSILRGAAPLAPSELRSDFDIVRLAYEQIQDAQDGAITGDRATRVGTPQLATAMSEIDEYTARACGVHVAQVLPTAPADASG